MKKIRKKDVKKAQQQASLLGTPEDENTAKKFAEIGQKIGYFNPQKMPSKSQLIQASRRAGKTINTTLSFTNLMLTEAGFSEAQRADILRITAMAFGIGIDLEEDEKT